MAFANQTITFHSDAVAADTLVVKQMAGQEQLSGMFRFDLELLSKDKELDLEAVVAAPARIAIKQKIAVVGGAVASRLREFAGVLTEFEQHEEGQGWVSYRATLVPKVQELAEFWRSRIFQGKSAPQIVKEVLTDFGLSASAPKVFGDFHFGDGIADRLRAPTKDQDTYPLRDYIVQYEESDWDFLARWLEHEGIYFFFENKDQKERIVFNDNSPGSEPVSRNPSEATFRYRPQTEAGTVGSSEEEVIVQFLCRQTRAPKEVALNDYNWRDAVRLSTVQKVDDKGVGLQTEYNDHYKNADQGKALAQVRKEELLCRKQLYHGVSNSRGFRPGKTFTLSEHYRGDWNKDYLLVSVQHAAEQSVNLDAAMVTGATYHNSFTAIPLATPFRPERETEWPSIKGVMHGKVDAAEGNEYADLDEDGCYTVRIPYDPHFDNEDEAKAGGASRRMRMAQPFSGMDAGFHFPLRKGTEVILTHIDGDPDRPIIAGAVPNAETGNVGHSDESRNRIVSNSGNRFEIHDTEGSAGFLVTDTTTSVLRDERNRLAPASSGGGEPGGGGGGAAGPRPARVKGAPAVRPRPKTPAEVAQLQGRDLPQGGAGMTTPTMGGDDDEEKVTGAQGGYADGTEGDPASALAAFLAGDAVGYLATQGYVGDPAHGAITSSDIYDAIDKAVSKHTLFGSAGDATYQSGTLMANLGNVLGAVGDAKAHFDDGDAYQDESPDAVTSNRCAFLSAVNNFEGLAFGSRLRVWLGDNIQINKGNKYTYADVTHDVSYGTGGYGFHEENGDTNDESYQYGSTSSASFTYGDSNDHSETTGNAMSYSQTIGDTNDTSFFFGTKVSFDFKASAETSTEVALSAVNSNSLHVGAKGGMSIFVGGEVAIDLSLAAYLKLTMALVPGFEIKLAPSWGQVTVPHKAEIDVAKMKVALDDTQAALNKTAAAVANNHADVARTNAALKKTVAALKNDDAFLASNEAALNSADAILTKNAVLLSHSGAALSDMKTAASSTTLSGAHVIS